MNKEYVFLGRMQPKTRDYIKNLERENRMLEHNWNELKKCIKDEIEKREHTIFRQEQLGILTTPRLRNIQMEEVPYKKMLSKMQELEEGGNNERTT